MLLCAERDSQLLSKVSINYDQPSHTSLSLVSQSNQIFSTNFHIPTSPHIKKQSPSRSFMFLSPLLLAWVYKHSLSTSLELCYAMCQPMNRTILLSSSIPLPGIPIMPSLTIKYRRMKARSTAWAGIIQNNWCKGYLFLAPRM